MTFTKSLFLIALGVAATSIAFGCAREPGEPEPFPPAWNADDIAKGRCVATCMPDFGPRPITQEECAREEAGLEFFPVPVWDFETPSSDGTRPIAALAYAYQDGTTEFLSTAATTCTVEEHAALPDDTTCQAGYEPTTAPVDRCGSAHAWHVRGGPFREWGGGIGRRLDSVAENAAAAIGGRCVIPPPENPDPSTPAFCPDFDRRIAEAPGVVIRPGTDTEAENRHRMNQTAYARMQVDLREWEGISFWARRGPDSQLGFRVALADKNIDDDASMLETAGGLEPRCRRAKECDCRNHRPCTPGPNGGLFCWDPKLDASPTVQRHPWNHEPPRCGVTQCDHSYPAYPNEPDWPFYTPERTDIFGTIATATCQPFTFKNDITRSYCYDEADGPTPAEGFERCGDPWFSPVRLSTDWEFFRVPFSELRQEGYGKEFPAIDLSAVTMVRFTWTVGWVDYWIDDVRFFRRK